MCSYISIKRDQFSPQQAGLPPELLEQIAPRKTLEWKATKVFAVGGGTLTLSEFLVGFYQLHDKILNRASAGALLSKMKTAGKLAPTGNKGEYRLVSEEE